MRQESPMGRAASRKRRSFTKEFKAEVLQLYRAGDRSTSRVAKDLDLMDTAVREWVRQALRRDARAPREGEILGRRNLGGAIRAERPGADPHQVRRLRRNGRH